MVQCTAGEVDRSQNAGLISSISLRHKKIMGSHQGVSRKISSYLNTEKITMAVEENDAEQ